MRAHMSLLGGGGAHTRERYIVYGVCVRAHTRTPACGCVCARMCALAHEAAPATPCARTMRASVCGTCRGRAEPSYYGRVEDNIQWLTKYVPQGEVCEVGKPN